MGVSGSMMARDAVDCFDMLGVSVAAYEQRRRFTAADNCMARAGDNPYTTREAVVPRVRRVSLRGGFHHRGEGRRLVMAGRIVWE